MSEMMAGNPVVDDAGLKAAMAAAASEVDEALG